MAGMGCVGKGLNVYTAMDLMDAFNRHWTSEACEPDFSGGRVWREWMTPHGNGADSKIVLGVGFHAQGDYWLHLRSNYRADPIVEMLPRFRNPGNGGGGNPHTFKAVAKLGTALDRAAATQAWLPFPHQPLDAAPWISRHLDEDWGDIAMAVGRDGAITLALIQNEKPPVGFLGLSECDGFWVGFSPSLTPGPVYTALGDMYRAIEADNRDYPGMRGNHG